MTIRLAYLVSHPIQYQAPLLRQLASVPGVDLKVFFRSDFSVRNYTDEGFGQKIEWDVPLLEGYQSEFLSSWRGLFVKLRQKQFDVLWLHGYATPYYLYAIVLAKLFGIKVLVRGESWEWQNSFAQTVKRTLLFLGLRWFVDGFLAVGARNRNFYLKYHVPAKKIFSAPYVVDNDFFQKKISQARMVQDAFRKELGLQEHVPVILYASKLQFRKRAVDLFQAYVSLCSQLDVIPYLLFVGDGEMRAELEEMARGFDRVKFLGFQNQTKLPAFYDLCDVFVLPSKKENWGLVINEAMNAGKPMIVTDEVGCAADLVQSGENGFVYQAGDVKALEKALQTVLSDTNVMKKMGDKSLEIINHWGIDEAVQGIVAACQAVVK